MAVIYELAKELAEVTQALENEFDPQEIIDTLQAYVAPYEEQMVNVAKWLKNLKAEEAATKEEIKVLQKRAKAKADKAHGVEEYIKSALIISGRPVNHPVMPIKLAKCPPSLGYVDESKVPEDFIKTETIKKIDKRALLAAAKVSDIDGVEVVYDNKRVKIG